MATEKILLDTDIGNDLDDAVCLAYLLAQPQCELLGITTVSDEPEKRAMLADVLVRHSGKKVPIYPGIGKPLIIKPVQKSVPQASLIGKWEHSKSFGAANGVSAIEFMRRTIRDNPHEVTLLAIGPMTNIAVLLSTDPEITGLLKKLVLMCGVFSNITPIPESTEWNALCDPHAAAIVYNAAKGTGMTHRSIGLDVTTQVRMSKDEVAGRFSADLLRPVLDFAPAWFSHAQQLVFHDPLAAASIFDDRICGFTKGDVDIELESTRLKGYTHFKKSDIGAHEVALEVNPGLFFEHYFGVFNSIDG